MRHTTFRFTLAPTREQREVLRRHTGAARFAYNQALRVVIERLEAKKTTPEIKVPWSGFDLINAFNRWKVSEEAGVDEAGRSGLSWRREVCQQVFEEAAVDLGRALAAFSASRKGERRGKAVRFPNFKKKFDGRQSFRLRNKKSEIRVGEGKARSIRLPKLGVMAVRESTRKLRRMLKKGRAKILFATVREGAAGRWSVSLNIEAASLHSARQHGEGHGEPAVGIDRGLRTFAVVAEATGRELERIDSPRPLRASLPKLRRQSRALSRKEKGSRNRHRARKRLAQLHRRISNVRHDSVSVAPSSLRDCASVLEPAGQDPPPPGSRESMHDGIDANASRAFHRRQRLGALRHHADLQGRLVRRRAHLRRPFLSEHAPLQRVRARRRTSSAVGTYFSLQPLRSRGRPRHQCCSLSGPVPRHRLVSRRRQAGGDAKRLWRGER